MFFYQQFLLIKSKLRHIFLDIKTIIKLFPIWDQSLKSPNSKELSLPINSPACSQVTLFFIKMSLSQKVTNGSKQSQLKKESESVSLISPNNNWVKSSISNYLLSVNQSTVEILLWLSKVSKWLLISTHQSQEKLLALMNNSQETPEQSMNLLKKLGFSKLNTTLNHLVSWTDNNTQNWPKKAIDCFTHCLFLSNHLRNYNFI